MQDPVSQRFTAVDGKFVQVLHVDNNHWIWVAGNTNDEASVYDSMGVNLSQDIVHVTARMIKCEDEEFIVKPMPVEHQTDGNNTCGLFALVFTEEIDPSEQNYGEKALRNHLLQCFRNNEINQFPQNDKTSLWKANFLRLFTKHMRHFLYAEMFSSRKTKWKNQETSWKNAQDVGNGVIVNAN